MNNDCTDFVPLYFAEKLRVLNRYGSIGLVTLWSDLEHILQRLSAAGADLSKLTSPICVVGNLYGEGLKHLLRNLLFNPQIETLLVMGTDRSGSLGYLQNFFELGTEEVRADIEYVSESGIEIKPVRIVGSNYIMDDLVTPTTFLRKPDIVRIEGVDTQAAVKASRFLGQYRPSGFAGPRQRIPVPEVRITRYPSNLRAHTIVADTPAEAWKLLVHRIVRFGDRVAIEKGERVELQNVKVVIERPKLEPPDIIMSCGFDPDRFSDYAKSMFTAQIPGDLQYTYGNRLCEYFNQDLIVTVVDKMRVIPDDRTAYLSLWDNQADLDANYRPCLVAIYFRRVMDTLHMTAIFRTHNAANAWLENVHGLVAVQQHVASAIGAGIGALTVISMSISVDPQSMERPKRIHDEVVSRNWWREDPNGYFVITIDSKDLVVQHMHGGVSLGEYRAKRPEKIQHELYRNACISDVSHAMYIGRQLERAYRCIKEGREYVQDS